MSIVRCRAAIPTEDGKRRALEIESDFTREIRQRSIPSTSDPVAEQIDSRLWHFENFVPYLKGLSKMKTL
jgi:hypothetical protein